MDNKIKDLARDFLFDVGTGTLRNVFSIVEAAMQAGYAAGRAAEADWKADAIDDAYDAGYNDGYAQGEGDGYGMGVADGYDDGFEDGLELVTPISEGAAEAFDEEPRIHNHIEGARYFD